VPFVIEIKDLAPWPDENLPLDSYLECLVKPLAITAKQLRAIAEDFAYRRATTTDDLPQLIREEADNLAMLLRRRKVFELAARTSGHIP
jgi:hypothetical protein